MNWVTSEGVFPERCSSGYKGTERGKNLVWSRNVAQCTSGGHEVQPQTDVPPGIPGAHKASIHLTCCNEPGSQVYKVNIRFCLGGGFLCPVTSSASLIPSPWSSFLSHRSDTQPLPFLLLASLPPRTCNTEPSFCPFVLPPVALLL